MSYAFFITFEGLPTVELIEASRAMVPENGDLHISLDTSSNRFLVVQQLQQFVQSGSIFKFAELRLVEKPSVLRPLGRTISREIISPCLVKSIQYSPAQDGWIAAALIGTQG